MNASEAASATCPCGRTTVHRAALSQAVTCGHCHQTVTVKAVKP